MNWPERLTFVAMFLSVAGFALLWWRELLGGLLVVAATAAFYGLNYYASGRFPTGAFPLFYIPGILAILSWGLAAAGLFSDTRRSNPAPSEQRPSRPDRQRQVLRGNVLDAQVTVEHAIVFASLASFSLYQHTMRSLSPSLTPLPK